MRVVTWKYTSHMHHFKKILIANRGEIACRVIRTCKALGITSVAVFSEADRQAQHVKQADEAYSIGPSASKESYLCGDKIIEVARACKADAIHPGYGFLSENADFAQACADSKIIFIGPSPAAIRQMGSKAKAKALMIQHKVPTLPAYVDKDQSEKTLLKAAEKIGFPVLIKASYGGGGRGMRVVEKAEDFSEGLQSAQREALNSFGNAEVIIEKFLANPRHIEVQIFGDTHQQCVYLFERDCSIQRRHQKVVEEAPAPGVDDKLRKALGEAAVRAAKAIDYTGAGTIEFLLDLDGQFYFMEMNTRLQVEHPVTEQIVGEDLVAWQIAVAQGAKLPKQQHELKIHGAAMEVRLCAEDPYHQFLPSTGKIEQLIFPEALAQFRVDTGYISGDVVSIYYDSLLAKLIAWGEDREAARHLLLKALDETEIIGVKTNRQLLSNILREKNFANAPFSTSFIAEHEAQLLALPALSAEVIVAAGLYCLTQILNESAQSSDPWHSLSGFRLNQSPVFDFSFQYEDKIVGIVFEKNADRWRVKISNDEIFYEAYVVQIQKDFFQFNLDQRVHYFRLWSHEKNCFIHFENQSYPLQKLSRFPALLTDSATENQLVAPMPGRIISCTVAVGDTIKAGQTLLIMEAMKMEHTLRAPYDGVIQALHCSAGDIVSEGMQLVEIQQ